MRNIRKLGILIVIGFISISFLGGCAPTKFNVIPEKAAITPALIKQPIKFVGVGFQPNEPVSIEMIVPKDMKIKGQSEDCDRVGIAVAVADNKGNFEVAMGALTTLNTLFQVGWTPTLTPDFKKATPLPPGKYVIVATGIESDKVAKNVLEFVPPPKKK